MKKRLAILAALSPLAVAGVVIAAPAPKYFVCKYVGTPGVNETLQTGNNPISVSGNALSQPVVIGSSFADAQGRSLVVAEDTGQPDPVCPTGQGPQTPPVVPPVITTPPATPPTTPPVDVPQVITNVDTPQGEGK